MIGSVVITPPTCRTQHMTSSREYKQIAVTCRREAMKQTDEGQRERWLSAAAASEMLASLAEQHEKEVEPGKAGASMKVPPIG